MTGAVQWKKQKIEDKKQQNENQQKYYDCDYQESEAKQSIQKKFH